MTLVPQFATANDYETVVLGLGVSWSDDLVFEVRFLFWGFMLRWAR